MKKWGGDSPSSNVWTDFGASGASFAVGEDFVAAIPKNHASVLRTSGA